MRAWADANEPSDFAELPLWKVLSTYRKRYRGQLLALTDNVKNGLMPMLTLPAHPLRKVQGLVLGGCEVGQLVSVTVLDVSAWICDGEVIPGHHTPPLE
jgi:hypothetical protein